MKEKTTREIVEQMLLSGKHINKFDMLNATNSVCLAQRIQEIREDGWNVMSKAIEGKGNLAEYWLEKEEIERITEGEQMGLGFPWQEK